MKTINTLEAEIIRLKEQLDEARAEKDEALELVGEMRQHLQDHSNTIDSWIDIFEMTRDERGVWMFDGQASLFNQHNDLLTDHRKLISEWNRFVGRYNTTVAPRDAGRPLAASEAQIAKVKELRKAGSSLRATTKETGLSLRTVRTILDNAAGKGRGAERKFEIRRKEFSRLRAASFRARHGKLRTLPKEISRLQRSGDQLLKAARGLAKSKA